MDWHWVLFWLILSLRAFAFSACFLRLCFLFLCFLRLCLFFQSAPALPACGYCRLLHTERTLATAPRPARNGCISAASLSLLLFLRCCFSNTHNLISSAQLLLTHGAAAFVPATRTAAPLPPPMDNVATLKTAQYFFPFRFCFP